MKKAFFFDMDGVLFDSMPNHAQAWDDVMKRHGLHFTYNDCYLQEGRTGQSVIDECYMKQYGRHALREEWEPIYAEKTERFHALGGAKPIPGIKDVLTYLQQQGALVFIVTGSGQQSLFDMLEREFPGVFTRDRMVTAHDVTHGKPAPEPYLKAFAKAQALYASLHPDQASSAHSIPAQFHASLGMEKHPVNASKRQTKGVTLQKEDCVVIENAPLGTRSGRAAGLDVYAVNTGPLSPDVFVAEDATHIFPDMTALLHFLQEGA